MAKEYTIIFCENRPKINQEQIISFQTALDEYITKKQPSYVNVSSYNQNTNSLENCNITQTNIASFSMSFDNNTIYYLVENSVNSITRVGGLTGFNNGLIKKIYTTDGIFTEKHKKIVLVKENR